MKKPKIDDQCHVGELAEESDSKSILLEYLVC